MRYNIYCDESCTHQGKFMLIGGLWVPWEADEELRARMELVRFEHDLGAEMKWGKVSWAKLAAYKDFVDAFFQVPSVAFKCIVVRRATLDYRAYHKSDRELGFYKFYFQLISRNLAPEHLYWLYTDERQNRNPNRLDVLQIATNRWTCKKHGIEHDILRKVEPCCSRGDDLVQLADILLGSISYAYNARWKETAKRKLMWHITRRFGLPFLRLATAPSHPRLNIWVWKPSRPQKETRPRP